MLCEVKNIIRKYPTPGEQSVLTVLDGISLSIEAGQSLAVVGPSGSGKTTLLNMFATLDTPDSGEVLIDGRDVTHLGEEELASVRNDMIGVVFQAHHLLPQCTLLQNVLIPTLVQPRTRDREEFTIRAEKLLERVGLADKRNHLPGQMSGGECQRAAVVRALINKPRILCADEPTGSLDRAASDSLAELLVELNNEEHTALLVVTHSAELAGRMDRRYELRDGHCTEKI
jgi:ABC-type lipoprotein export system ATPase subunit